MEDSELVRVDDATTAPGLALGYPEGRKLPGAPPGWVGQLRSMPKATDETIKFAERTGRRCSPRIRARRSPGTSSALWDRVRPRHGNPMMGDDPELADLFFAEDGSLWFLRRVDRPRCGARDGAMGGSRCGHDRPQRPATWRDASRRSGTDLRLFPSDCWGRRDWAQAEARYQPLGKTLPAPAPAHALPAGFSLYPDHQRAPETKGERAVREIRAKLGSRR